MPITINYKLGDIILVPFPFTNLIDHKKRPALVISSELYSRERADIILMPVTSQIKPQNTLGIIIENWEAAGLLKPSVIKPLIATIEKNLVLKKLGELTAKNHAAIFELINKIIG